VIAAIDTPLKSHLPARLKTFEEGGRAPAILFRRTGVLVRFSAWMPTSAPMTVLSSTNESLRPTALIPTVCAFFSPAMSLSDLFGIRKTGLASLSSQRGDSKWLGRELVNLPKKIGLVGSKIVG
jgi:hypothetical protein